MRILVLLVGAVVALVTPPAGADEVPFVTTPDAVTQAMLELAEVGPQDRLIDLGSGDGRIVITAARRFDTRGLGVEIVPDLVERSRRGAQAAGVADRAEFRVQDLFDTDLQGFSVVTMYLLPQVNLQLRARLLALKPGTRIVSHDWDLGDWKPERTVEVEVPDKPIGLEKRSRVHRWTVPARIEGRWCGPDVVVVVRQRFDAFTAEWTPAHQRTQVLDGRLRGLQVEPVGFASASLALTMAGDTLQLSWDGRSLKRCAG